MFAILKPKALLILIFLFLIVLQGVLGSSSATYPLNPNELPTYQLSFGYYSPLVISGVGESYKVIFNWPILILNLLFTYILAATGDYLIRRLTGIANPFRLYLSTTVVVLSLAVVVAVCTSKYYWGYFFTRPELLPAFEQIEKITSVSRVNTEQLSEGKREFAQVKKDEDDSILSSIQQPDADPYYSFHDRALVRLHEKNILPAHETALPSDLKNLYELMRASGILSQQEKGYVNGDRLYGTIIDGTRHDGSRIIFIGVNGGEVSNDHHPYYELILESSEEGGFQIIDSQRFYYDVAGIEGAEWYAFAIGFGIIGLIVTIPVLTLVLLIKRKICAA